MKKMTLSTFALFLVAPLFSPAASLMEGSWKSSDGSKLVEITEFNGSVTFSTTAYYNNGAEVNWFFDYRLPKGRDAQVGETNKGRVRSVDGYYNCVFDESAEAKLESNGILKIRFPLLTYHRETRSVREGGGYYHERRVVWDGWGWTETRYGFPVDRYRVVSSECVVDQRNWVTNTLTKTNAPFSPAPR